MAAQGDVATQLAAAREEAARLQALVDGGAGAGAAGRGEETQAAAEAQVPSPSQAPD